MRRLHGTFGPFCLETHTETFVQAVQDLYPKVHALAEPLILLGYSQGACVARLRTESKSRHW